MRIRLSLLVLFILSFALLNSPILYGEEPEEGKNYIWIDLGEENEGFLLTLAPDGGDGITEPDEKADVDCRKLPFPYAGPGHNHMYFDIDDSFMKGGDNEVWMAMEYFDEGIAIDCQYDSNGAGPVDGAFRGAGDGAFDELQITNTEEWLVHVWHILDGRFENRGNGHDFRFSTHARGDMWVNRIWIFTYEPPDPFNSDDLSIAKAIDPNGKLAAKWGVIRSIF